MAGAGEELFGVACLVLASAASMVAVASCVDNSSQKQAQQFFDQTFTKITPQSSNKTLKNVWFEMSFNKEEAKDFVDAGWKLNLEENANQKVQFSVQGKTIILNANNVADHQVSDVTQLFRQLAHNAPAKTACYAEYYDHSLYGLKQIPCGDNHLSIQS